MSTPLRAAVALSLAVHGAAAQLPPSTAEFRGGATVTVPLRVVHGLAVIPVTINGHGPLQMILDTGAPVIVIPDTALASRLGLQIVGRARVGGAGDGDQQTAPLAAGITATVGTLTVTGAYGIVGIAGDVIPGVDGVIGGAFFRHAVVEFDWDARLIRFHDPASRIHARGDTLPLRVEPSLHAYVTGTVVVNGDTARLDLHMDTGARQALSLAPSSMAKLPKPKVSIPTIVGFGSRGAARGDVIRADALRLGSATIADITTAVPKNEPADQGRVGLPVLQRFNFFVDYPGKRLILQPRAGRNEPFRFTTTGIVLIPGRDSVVRVVADVIDGSPAQLAGIAVGDSVIAVGSVGVATLTEDGVRATLLTPTAGSTLTVATKRGATRSERQLVARTLLP